MSESASLEPRSDTRPRSRPVSPHLSIWAWTVTMATSISHRATGIALYSGYAVLTIWLISAALGEGPYDAVTGFLGSPIGLLILVGYTWAQMYHLSNGIRHLIWDSGHMLSREQGKISAWTVYASSVVLTILIWIAAFTMGG